MKKVSKVIIIICLLALIYTVWTTAALAQQTINCEKIVFVKAGDSLSKLANKFFGDPSASPAIAAATNIKAADEDSYASIKDVDFVKTGWKLCIPSAADAQALLNNPGASVTINVSPLPDIGAIQVGYIPILGFAPYFVAVENGYFAQQGLKIELQSFRSGSQMIALLSTGRLDVGAGEIGPALLNAINKNFDVTVVCALASQPSGFGAVPLLVRKDLFDSREIAGPANLAGRKIALNVERGTAEYLLSEALSKAKLTIDEVEIVTLPFPEVPVAFENKAIEAAMLPHPLAAKAIRSGNAITLMEGDEITDSPQNGVVYFGQKLLQPKNREVGVRFLIAYLKAVRDIHGDGWRSDKNVAIINKYTNVPIPAIKKGVAYYFEPNGKINMASMEKFQVYHFNRGYTGLTELLPLDKIVIDAYLKEALARIGRFR